MAARKGTRPDALVGLAVFVGVLAVYIVTLCPTIYPGGESLGAVTAATKTGFVKSMRYPVWLFLGGIFASVSANKAWALNLLSAVCGAASIALLYGIFARFGHTRTRDELARFRGQPGLARYAALGAALLVAFSHTFWRASVTAGTLTLNALMLVLVTSLLLWYRETRKKRYFILYGAVYAIGVANFPTMLLLLPVFVTLSVIWGREVFSDIITLVVTLVLSAVLLGLFSLAGPVGFSSGLPGYFLKPIPITRPMFDYLAWYWAQIRMSLPVGGFLGFLYWLAWLVLPTVPPLVYLAFTKPRRHSEMGHGSVVAGGIFKFLGFVYTLTGIMALYDFVMGPYAMVKSEAALGGVAGLEGFLVVYMIIGGWLCYMFGYWVVLFTAKPRTAGPSGPPYSKPAYAALVALFLVLPVASLVKHAQVDKTGLAGFTAAEDFAHDTLASAASAADAGTGDRAVILVTGGDDWGSLLRYVLEHRYVGEISRDIVIADIRSANRHDRIYVDKHRYLNAVLLGDGKNPVRLPPELDPANDSMLGDTPAAVRYVGLASGINRKPPAAVCLTGDLDRYVPESAMVNYAYEMVPRGLVYLLSLRGSYPNVPDDHVKKGRELWSGEPAGRLRLSTMAARPLEEWPATVQLLLRRASKVCNDFGVYCHKHAGDEQAIELYHQTLRLDDMNLAGLRNLEIAGDDDPDLTSRINRADMRLKDQVANYLRESGVWNAAEDVKEGHRKYGAALNLMYNYGLVRDTQVVSDFLKVGLEIDPRTKTFESLYSALSLAALVDPSGDAVLAERGGLYLTMLGRSGSLDQRVRALLDLQAGEPDVEKSRKALTQFQIGEMQVLLGNIKEAEAAYEKATELDPDNAGIFGRLADLYSATDRTDKAIELVKDRAKDSPPQPGAEVVGFYRRLRAYYQKNEDPEGFVAFANEYAQTNPEHGLTTKMFLLDMAVGDKDYEHALEIANDLMANYDSPASVRVRLVGIYLAQKRYEDVLAMPELTEDDEVNPPELIQWHTVRGSCYLQQLQPVPALAELKKAYTVAEGLVQRMRGETPANVIYLRGRVAFAALQAAMETGDPETEREALAVAEHYLVLARGSRDAGERSKMMAACFFGWVRFQFLDEIELPIALIEPAIYGLPTSASPGFYLGSVLIKKGEQTGDEAAIVRGVGLVKKSIEAEEPGGLNTYDRPRAEQLLEQYKDRIPAEPEEPAEPTEPEEPAGSEEPAEPDRGADTEPGDAGADTTPDTPPDE